MPSEAGDEQAPEPPKSTENLEQVLLKGDGDHGKDTLNNKPSTTNMACDKEKEKDRKKPIKPDQEPFEAWEREEMEKLLGELRGHLGERLFPFLQLAICDRPADASTSRVPNAILGRRGHREQFPLQRR